MSDATTTLLTSWEEKTEDHGNGFIATVFSPGGNPHTTAIFNAVTDHYNRITGRPRPSQEDVAALLGQKVTIVNHGENFIGGKVMGAIEGTIRLNGSGSPFILPKRAKRKGYRIEYDKLIDVIPGYAPDQAQAYVDEVRSHFPKLIPLTQERFNSLPGEGQNGELMTMCVFGTYDLLPGCKATDVLILLSEYWPEDDILDREVLLIRPEHGFSESGSVYGRHLLRGNFGEVVGFEPMLFVEALELCNLDFDEAYERVIGRTKVAA